MNIGKYQQKLSEWMRYKRYSEQSVKAYVSCIGKFLQHFEGEATKPSEISAEKIKKFLTCFMITRALIASFSAYLRP